MTIPVLICPVIGDFDLVETMLSTIDEPIGRIVIVDNSLSGWVSSSALPISYIRPIMGLGYPGGINAGIAQTPDAPWWMFASADLAFRTGDLAGIAERMEVDDRPRVVTGTDRRLRFAYGAVNRACVEQVGLMDEWAFYPIYFDDDDYQRRCHLADVDWVGFDGAIHHLGSRSLADPDRARANSRTYPVNQEAYLRKWGGSPGHEVYRTPYDLPVPLSFVKPDPAARAARRW